MLKFKKILPYIAFLCVALAILFLPKVSQVDCRISSQLCGPEILKYLESLKNSRVFFIDHQKNLAEAHNQILPFKIISLRKKLPSTLQFELEHLTAVYKLTTSDTNETFGVSSEGTFVPLDERTIVTEVLIAKNLILIEDGRVNSSANSTVINILNAVPKTRQLEKVVYISPQEIKLFFTKTPLILVADPVPVYALQHLDSILYTVEQTPLESPSKEIDLRFSLPVLRTEG